MQEQRNLIVIRNERYSLEYSKKQFEHSFPSTVIDIFNTAQWVEKRDGKKERNRNYILRIQKKTQKAITSRKA